MCGNHRVVTILYSYDPTRVDTCIMLDVVPYSLRKFTLVLLFLLSLKSVNARTGSEAGEIQRTKMSTTDRSDAASIDNDTCLLPVAGSNKNLDAILADLQKKYAHQPTFLQAVQETALSLQDLLEENGFYRQAFAVMTEPERTISFRVPWMDDRGQLQYNRGWRVEFSRYVMYCIVSLEWKIPSS